MKLNKFCTTFFIPILFFSNVSAREMSGSGGGPSNAGATLDIPGPSDEVREGYETRCSETEKRQRIEKHNQCKERFNEMGLERVVNDDDIIQKFSCSKLESFWREAAVGCAKYAISLPVDIVRGLGAALGIGRYNAQIERACGRTPQRRMSRPTDSSMPDGQVRYESQGTEARYQSAINSFVVCRTRVVEALEAREARESANYTSSMQATRRYCSEQNPQLAALIRNSARIRPGSNRDKMVRSCRLEALTALGLECSRCVSELSPETGNIENSSFFRSMVDSLKQYNPRALQCYNAEKIGELACAAAGAAAGGAGAAIAAAKVARALGRGAADRAIAAGRRAIDGDSSTATAAANPALTGAQASRAATQEILDNVDPQRAAAARRAAVGAGDSQATRQAYAEAVLDVPEGSLTARQSQAVWDAHRIADGSNEAKAVALRRGGFSDAQTRALMSPEYRVAGGYRGATASIIDEAPVNTGGSFDINDIGRELGDDGVLERDRYNRLPSESGNDVYWFRNPEVSDDVARAVRSRIDNNGIINNRQQRDEMLRVLAVDATTTAGSSGRAVDYNNLARYYERAGRPIDDDFIRYVNQRVDVGSNMPAFELNARVGESRMAIHRLRQEAGFYSDEMRVRGIDMSPSDGRARAAEIRRQITDIERNIGMYETMLRTAN